MDWNSCLQTIGGEKIPTFKCLEVVFARILTIAVSLAVLALFIMLVVGGFKFLTSGGDQKSTASAQQTMTFAFAGIVLMVIAFLIFRIIEVYTGVTITKFVIPQ
ncbi:hypothetical protein HY945_02700 [Candidatus Gottesmanbacteria bacterium]|nr:hypothetical protein [Candidatus Gottesmanbacteria bacterium]